MIHKLKLVSCVIRVVYGMSVRNHSSNRTVLYDSQYRIYIDLQDKRTKRDDPAPPFLISFILVRT